MFSSSKTSTVTPSWRSGSRYTDNQYLNLSTDAAARADTDAESEEPEKFQRSLGSNEAPRSDSSTPWYLQLDPPERESNPLQQRQRRPELPPDPPPLLQPILDHIFVDLGLDDLILFDLRKLDPPPALGANLVMVIGTARSEKHLHVSADRFCRWMKTTHGVAPYADGLLGRGELKLKLRRKARRARILSRVGSAENSNTDDGIKTGWICVTVDNIEDGRQIEEAPNIVDGYVGFGGDERGAKVVIQMLTREKREELDLEDLWGKTIQRNERKQGRLSQAPVGADLQQEVGQNGLHVEEHRTDFLSNTLSSSSSPPRPNHKQVIHPHDSALRGVRAFSTNDRYYSERAPLFRLDTTSVTSHERTEENLESSVADQFLAALPGQYKEEIRDCGKAKAETFRLRAHIDFAKSLSIVDARSIFGNGAQDATSTPFLRSFYDALPLFPTEEQWGIRLSFINIGMNVGAPGYSKHELALLFRELQSSLITISASLYKETIITLLKPSLADGDGRYPQLTTTSVYAAARILEDMIFCGHDISSSSRPDNDIRELLELAVVQAQPDARSPNFHPKALQRLRQLLYKIKPEAPPMDFEIRKLQACADKRNFQGMWDVWRHFAADMHPRSAEIYIAMLQGFAESGHQAKNMEVLRVLMPEMEREEPPVKMNREIAEAVMACMRVVDPGIEDDVLRFYKDEGIERIDGLGELHRLWLRCERAIQEEGRWARELDDD